MLLATLGNGDGMMVLAKLELGLEAGGVPGPAKASTTVYWQMNQVLFQMWFY
jgi:hypothetical protein